MDFGDILGEGGFGQYDDESGEQGTNAADLMMFGMDSQEIEDLRTQKDSVIFLIDCHKSMHEPNPHSSGQESNIEQILRASLGFIKSKIISNENDKIAIVLYGVSKDGEKVKNQNSLDFKNVHILYDLDVPDANLIKTIENKISTFAADHGHFPEKMVSETILSKADPSQINSCLVNESASLVNPSGLSNLGDKSGIVSGTYSNEVCKVERSPLFEALWICGQQFKTIEKQLFAKRIFLFTDNDFPGQK